MITEKNKTDFIRFLNGEYIKSGQENKINIELYKTICFLRKYLNLNIGISEVLK